MIKFVLEKAVMENADLVRRKMKRMMKTNLKMRKNTTMKEMKCITTMIRIWMRG